MADEKVKRFASLTEMGIKLICRKSRENIVRLNISTIYYFENHRLTLESKHNNFYKVKYYCPRT